MSEPFFPPPQKKESAPFRTAAIVAPAPVATARRPPPPIDEELVAPKKMPAPVVEEPQRESFLATFAWRFGVRVVALGLVIGILYGLVLASESGAKWPQLVLVVLGALGILASPFILFMRLRRLWRMLFARDDAG